MPIHTICIHIFHSSAIIFILLLHFPSVSTLCMHKISKHFQITESTVSSASSVCLLCLLRHCVYVFYVNLGEAYIVRYGIQ